VLLLPRYGGAKKNSPRYAAEARASNSVWLKHFLASSASTQAKPAFF
jgi:hypothetical protein